MRRELLPSRARARTKKNSVESATRKGVRSRIVDKLAGEGLSVATEGGQGEERVSKGRGGACRRFRETHMDPPGKEAGQIAYARRRGHLIIGEIFLPTTDYPRLEPNG